MKNLEYLTESFYHKGPDGSVIDPKDKNLVIYNKDKKWFIVEASDLHAAGIQPKLVHYMGKNTESYKIFSHTELAMITYIKDSEKRDPEGELMVTIYKPWFQESYIGMSSGLAAYAAAQERLKKAALGTELHVLND